ncbi:MAG: glycoside hydrolase family 10 protein [Lachnospiraceae bacterium]
MKRKRNIIRRITSIFLSAVMLCGVGASSAYGAAVAGPSANEQEMRGVWISYLDWDKIPSEQSAFRTEVNKILDRCVELRMNTVFVHVRPDGDAMYPSSYFPWSKFVTGMQGQDPGYDPLAYFIEASHERGLKFHAWVNPYRVTGYLNTWEDVSASSPAKQWLVDSDSSNDRWVLHHSGKYYFNPAVAEVRQLIIDGVKEITANYNVDGIHFDDYFYPDVNDNYATTWFDKPEYDASGSSLAISQWRRENVNQLVREVYHAVKEINPQVEFGISPEGYVQNLRSDSRLFVDIDTWMSQDGYMDYIIPQIYWGFEHKLSNGSPAPFAFSNNLQTWIELKNRGNVKLYLGLAMYKTGSNTNDNNEVPEWLRYQDIMKRQVEEGRASGQVSGYCFYAFSSFQDSVCQPEVENLMKVLN